MVIGQKEIKYVLLIAWASLLSSLVSYFAFGVIKSIPLMLSLAVKY